MMQWYRIFPLSGIFSWNWSVGCSSCPGPLHMQSEKGSQGWIFLTGVILLLIFSCLLLLQVGWSNLFTILVKSTTEISIWLCLLPPSQGRQRCLFPAAFTAPRKESFIHHFSPPAECPACHSWNHSPVAASQNKSCTRAPPVDSFVGSNGWVSVGPPCPRGNCHSNCRCSSVVCLALEEGDGANWAV